MQIRVGEGEEYALRGLNRLYTNKISIKYPSRQVPLWYRTWEKGAVFSIFGTPGLRSTFTGVLPSGFLVLSTEKVRFCDSTHPGWHEDSRFGVR
jgi:hypothetical protein